MKLLSNLMRAGRSNEFTFRYVFNCKPALAYKFAHHPLTAEAARVLADLKRDGVAVTSAAQLLGADSCYDELRASVDRREAELAAELAQARQAALSADATGQKKTFIYPLLGDTPVLDAHAAYVRFALQPPLLRIANAYCAMYTRLCYFNVWRTFATQAAARTSQLWHRDRDDLHYVLKVFVYLSDVDEGAGPFTYARGTHSKGRLLREPEYTLEDGFVQRSTDAQMSVVVAPERWLQATGPAGTIIFADTRGYHKGGLARSRERVMFTCMFASSWAAELFERRDGAWPVLSREQSFAVMKNV